MKKKMVARPVCEQCRVTKNAMRNATQFLTAAHQGVERLQTLLQERNDETERLKARIDGTEKREERLQDLVHIFVRQLLPHLTPVQFWETVRESTNSCGFTPEAFTLEIQQALGRVAASGYADALGITRTIERVNEMKS